MLLSFYVIDKLSTYPCSAMDQLYMRYCGVSTVDHVWHCFLACSDVDSIVRAARVPMWIICTCGTAFWRVPMLIQLYEHHVFRWGSFVRVALLFGVFRC